MNFTAIDFETATSEFSSICSMGICVVENNQIVASKEFLIRPKPMIFYRCNMKVHGITPDMVKDSPTFDMLWDEIRPYIQDRLVVAHNASFDINALCAVLKLFNIEFPTLTYLCTVKLSQAAYPNLAHHRLNDLCNEFGIDFNHHRAGDDAYACARVLLRILSDFGLDSADELCNTFNLNIGKIYPGCHIKCLKKKKKKKTQNKDVSPNTTELLQ